MVSQTPTSSNGHRLMENHFSCYSSTWMNSLVSKYAHSSKWIAIHLLIRWTSSSGFFSIILIMVAPFWSVADSTMFSQLSQFLALLQAVQSRAMAMCCQTLHVVSVAPHICHNLSFSAAVTSTWCSFDIYNSIFAALLNFHLHQLQSVLSWAVQVMANMSKFLHISAPLRATYYCRGCLLLISHFYYIHF